MSHLIVETRPQPLPLAFSDDSGDLVWFLSFAAVEQFGSQHELSQAAMLLRHKRKLRLAPLLRFAAHDDDDPDELERVWQQPAPLAEAAEAVAAALESGDRQLRDLTAGFPSLPPLLVELAAMARWSEAQNCQIRLLYEL